MINFETLELCEATPGNPIEFDPETTIYTGWDAPWADIVCRTPYKHITEEALRIYYETVLKYPEGLAEDLKLELTSKANLANETP